ncbi:hypothetical protein A4D02_13370 [Niastella koreensis]|uniref:Lipoprotein n=2 Tax=Niastella koreensis TaxID=354356 RepID=G8TNL5_NIAKG|nr:hypothetical protein [Niastella koreensis]AEW00941.1 hypothetical protein Niako_4685 [Niastella koreensis GR20-10]OQP42550.1 hypothetical protein A4D02_13370 [Niastella koreensis]
MSKSIPIAVIPLLFCLSCTTFQYVTVSSTGIAKNNRNEFVVENDSLRLIYNFSGQNGPIKISIYNKLDVPVYIDWQRSAVIVNDKTMPYVPGEVQIEGSYSGSTYTSRFSHYGSSSGNISATAYLPTTVDFIPPKASINKTTINITSGYNSYIPDADFQKAKYQILNGFTANVKKAAFTEGNSPLHFRSFISYSVGESTDRLYTFEHSFFVSEVMSSGSSPEMLFINVGSRGDQYYSMTTN